MSQVQVPAQQGSENTCIEGERNLGFSLAESLPGKESFLLLLGSALIVRHESFPLLVFQLCLSEVSIFFLSRGYCDTVIYNKKYIFWSLCPFMA